MDLNLLKLYFFKDARNLNLSDFEGRFEADDFPVLVVKYGDLVIPFKTNKGEPKHDIVRFYINKINEAILTLVKTAQDKEEIAAEDNYTQDDNLRDEANTKNAEGEPIIWPIIINLLLGINFRKESRFLSLI